jgi:hypothetical protein
MSSDRQTVVLATVDGSIEAADGVLAASQLARAWGAELHVVHVWSGMTLPLIAPAAEGAARRLLADEVAGAVRKGGRSATSTS